MELNRWFIMLYIVYKSFTAYFSFIRLMSKAYYRLYPSLFAALAHVREALRKVDLRASIVSQLFVTMSANDMPLVHSKVQKELNATDYDALWQAQASETVLYYHDGLLKATKLSGGRGVHRNLRGTPCKIPLKRLKMVEHE